MTTQTITLGGVRVVRGQIHVPWRGAWWADLVLETSDDVGTGQIDLSIGDATMLTGTLANDSGGVFAEQRHARLIAGADGWRKPIAAQGYHNDAGVDALLVARDAALACGESLGSDVVPASPSLAADFVREAGLASVALESALGGAPWWIDYGGITRAGTRAPSSPAPEVDYHLLAFDPITHTATLACDDLGAVLVGATLAATEMMPDVQTVRGLVIEIDDGAALVKAWCGGEDGARERLARSLEQIVERVIARRLLVPLRYRVVRMNVDRAELQAVSRGAPDIGPVSLFPGMAGLHALLTGGAIVLVSFVEGDRARPVVVGFEGHDGPAWAPSELDLDATTLIKAGKNATDFVGRAPPINSQLDDINRALDAFATAVPTPMDGGAAIHTAFTAVWGPGAPPKPSSSVQASKVKAE